MTARFGRFELLELAGEGGMGRVYRARDPALDRLVALKLPSGLTPDGAARMAREARAAAALDHPHVVRIHEAGSWQGQPYLVMDWIEGPTLRALLRSRGRLRPAEAEAIAAGLAEALAAAHALGIVHRDLKPDNAFLSPDGRALLADFGLARVPEATRLTRSGDMVGTPGYMAPEQIQGGGGPPADVFALGVLLHELVTGAPPYQGTPMEQLEAALHGAPRPLAGPGVSYGLAELVRRCLEKDPAARPTAAEVARELRGDPRAPAPLGTAAMAAIGLSLVLLGGALGVLLLPSSQAEAPASGAAPTTASAPAAVPSASEPAPAPRTWYPALPDPPPLPARVLPGSVPGEYAYALPNGGALPVVWIPPADGQAGFFLARDEVSWRLMEAYLEAVRREISPPGEEMVGFERRPAFHAPAEPAVVTWLDARAFCDWAGLELPTLAQWQRAAGLDGPPPAEAPNQVTAADAGPPGRSGCRHLGDNLSEWLVDVASDHPTLGVDVLEPTPGCDPGELRLLAGGSWSHGPGHDVRLFAHHTFFVPGSGFRPAVPPPELAVAWEVEGCWFAPTKREKPPSKGPVRAWKALLKASKGRFGPVPVGPLALELGKAGPAAHPALAKVAKDAAEDHFALRARARVELPAGGWTLRIQADDGARAYVDEARVVDDWRYFRGGERRHAFRLEAAREVELVVEMVDLGGLARLVVSLRRDGER